jgi:hypothetical protein
MQQEDTSKDTIEVPASGQQSPSILTKSLDSLLGPYEPVEKERDADVQWSTNEMVAALEMHYGYPQGEADAGVIDGKELVEALGDKGFIAVNTGGLNLQWLMRKKRV